MIELLRNDGNKSTTYESIYIKKNMSEIHDIDQWPEGIFLV